MSSPQIVTPAGLRDWALPAPGSDKHDRGHVLVVGGAAATPGAVRLAGEAALRAGAGKLALATADRHVAALGVAVPESSVMGLAEDESGALAPSSAGALEGKAGSSDAVLVGPGFMDPDASFALLDALLPLLSTAVVLDAIATGVLADRPDALAHLEGRGVVCANPGELARIAGCEPDDVTDDPAGVSARVAADCGLVVLCGGTTKTVAHPDGRLWSIEAGGPGLGVSGSGDVQSGLVTGLLARGADPAQAAVWGGYLHARAGDRLAARVGSLGFLARELPDEVPAVLRELG